MNKFLISLIAGAAMFGAAQAQQLAPLNPTGQEVIEAQLGVGGTGIFLLLNQIRNTNGTVLVPTGASVTTNATNNMGAVIATGAITTWAITLPNPAFDGELFTVANGTGAAFTTNTSVTALTTPQNQTLAQAFASQTLAAGTSAAWQFNFTSLTWYRIR